MHRGTERIDRLIRSRLSLTIGLPSLNSFNMPKTSWDSYYKEYYGLLLKRHRLNIYLRDSSETVLWLSKLGYAEAYFSKNNPFFALFLECGQYCFTTTFEGEDDEEQEIPVIEIQHQHPRKYISRLSTGLCFMCNSPESDIADFVAKSFGLLQGMVHSVCMFEGDGHYSEAKDFEPS